ncbi:MAG: C1 family peptidase [Anaerolineae bacterium]|nr:C1 family peptidase [Anaerolineae bacterium]
MLTLEEVKKAIKDQCLDWVAADNRVGRNTMDGHLPKLGFAPKGREPGGYWRKGSSNLGRHAGIGMGSFFPDNPQLVDWGDARGNDYLPAIRDQKNCGACVAFAVCAVMEARAKIIKQDQNYKADLSVAQLFFCGVKEKDPCENGWQIGEALAFCRDNGGIGAEAAFPYDLSHTQCINDKNLIPPVMTVDKWRKVYESDQRLDAIREGGPVAGAMVVYSDFLGSSSVVYRPTTQEVIGLHAISIVGYDKTAGAWLVQNSWGRDWGKGGFARIAFGTCGIDHEYPFYDVKIRLL